MLLILYLMQNPHVQRKAQEEVDRIVGHERLPTWEDTCQLSYMNLVLQETYRMNPLSPLGIPHASVEDDIYEDMFIPKGTIIYQNVWAMFHDESVYANPFRFWPERYLPREEGGNGEPLPVGNFGFGRRYVLFPPPIGRPIWTPPSAPKGHALSRIVAFALAGTLRKTACSLCSLRCSRLSTLAGRLVRMASPSHSNQSGHSGVRRK